MNSLRGLFTALITPFNSDGSLNEAGFCDNLEAQLKAGVDGVVVLGTTGEAPSLSDSERDRLLELALERSKGKLHVCVGVGCNATDKTIERARRAQELGAHSALVVTPYYNKPTQRGLYEHFAAVGAATDLPLIIYNIPGRTGTNIDPLTMVQIAELPTVVGVKESAGDINQLGDILHHMATLPKDLAVFSGDDQMALPAMALGACGVISVLSNLSPAPLAEMVEAMENGEWLLARELHYRLLPLAKGLFFETNPIPIKEAMNYCGRAAGPCRLPLSPMADGHRQALHQLIRDAGLSPAGVPL